MFLRPGFQVKPAPTPAPTAAPAPAHSSYAAGNIHPPFNWVVANAAAKTAVAPIAADLYKALWQVDTATIYILTSVSPIIWTAVGSTGGSSSVVPATCYVSMSANVNMPNAVFTAVPFDTEVNDPLNAHSTTVNPERIVIPAGYTKVRLSCKLTWVSAAQGNRICLFAKNGIATNGGIAMVRTAPGAEEAGMSMVSPWMTTVPGDYYTLVIWQGSNAVLALTGPTGGYGTCWFQAEFGN